MSRILRHPRSKHHRKHLAADAHLDADRLLDALDLNMEADTAALRDPVLGPSAQATLTLLHKALQERGWAGVNWDPETRTLTAHRHGQEEDIEEGFDAGSH